MLQSRLTGLPVASVVNSVDVTLLNQGGNDFQVPISTLLAGTLQTINNLSDVPNPSAALTNIGALAKSGGTMTGALILNADPTNPLGAVTKQYADAIVAGINIKQACYAATLSNLNATYSNGTSGVGATLTNAGAQAVFSVDGLTPPTNSRILVKNQTSSFQNGIYILSVPGSVSTNWILTRATDYDSSAEIFPGNLIIIDNGTINAISGWLQTATVTSVGTDSISFSVFNASASSYLQVSNNLSDLSNVSTARTNLGLGTSAVQNVAFFAQAANNLSDLASASTARTNLGLGTSATHNIGDFAQTANNLSDLASVSSARTNLGLGTSAVQNVAFFCQAANNLSDVGSASTALANLGGVALAGSTMTGLLILSGDPANVLGAATKQYVDGKGWLTACEVATTANLSATYSNGSSGIGATLTNNSTQVALSIDGVSLSVGQRVLVKNQSSAIQNGIYIVTNIGSGSTNWVLTRATDYDLVAQIFQGTLVAITAGTTNTQTGWMQTAIVSTIGTDNVSFSQFGGGSGGAYLAIANNLSDLASVSTARTNLGLGSAALLASSAVAQTANNLSDLASASTARTNLGLGTAATQSTGTFCQVANNLSDVTASTARTNLGLGTAATQSTGTFCQVANNLSDVTAVTALANLGGLPIAGGTMTGALTLNADPTSVLHAATKQYIDNIGPKIPCVVATTANLTATYSNGTSGVGATLTNSGALAAISIDGVSLSSGQRVLVKNQSTGFQNGIYTVTTVGSGAVAWVLTRTTDYNIVAQMLVGSEIIVTSGTANANTSWIQTATVVTIGTSSVSFSQFGAVPSTFLKASNNLSDVNNRTTAFNNVAPASPAQGDIMYFDGSNWVKLAAGTAGYVLQTNGASANPTWVAGGLSKPQALGLIMALA